MALHSPSHYFLHQVHLHILTTRVIQMLISLPSYLVSIRTLNCNAYVKSLLPHVCVNNAYHLFSALSIKADHPMAGQKREEGGTSAIQGRNGEREEGREREREREGERSGGGGEEEERLSHQEGEGETS